MNAVVHCTHRGRRSCGFTYRSCLRRRVRIADSRWIGRRIPCDSLFRFSVFRYFLPFISWSIFWVCSLRQPFSLVIVERIIALCLLFRTFASSHWSSLSNCWWDRRLGMPSLAAKRRYGSISRPIEAQPHRSHHWGGILISVWRSCGRWKGGIVSVPYGMVLYNTILWFHC